MRYIRCNGPQTAGDPTRVWYAVINDEAPNEWYVTVSHPCDIPGDHPAQVACSCTTEEECIDFLTEEGWVDPDNIVDLATNNVRVTYAPVSLCGPTDMSNPYEPLQMTIQGSIPIVANWIDENLVAANAAAGDFPYQQGKFVPFITEHLERGGTFKIGVNSPLLKAERVV